MLFYGKIWNLSMDIQLNRFIIVFKFLKEISNLFKAIFKPKMNY